MVGTAAAIRTAPLVVVAAMVVVLARVGSAVTAALVKSGTQHMVPAAVAVVVVRIVTAVTAERMVVVVAAPVIREAQVVQAAPA